MICLSAWERVPHLVGPFDPRICQSTSFLFSAVCDFESAFICDYIHDPSSSVAWQRVQANGDTFVPSMDVSYGSSYGHLMFLRRAANASGTIGRLLTPVYRSNSASCLRWHMVLRHRAHLTIFVMPSDGLNRSSLYSIHGDQGSTWKLAQATIDQSIPFGILFEGILTDDLTNDDAVAIDDVELRRGPCPELGSCDFERDLCGYQSLSVDFDWKRTSFNLQAINAPLLDHTTSSRAGLSS